MAEADNMATWKGELDDLANLESGLTDWELRFVEDVTMRCLSDPSWAPSPKQRGVIGRIWDRCCGGG